MNNNTTNITNCNNEPLVSVVIPTYNRSFELQRAIRSVLSQTYQNFEILVVDDGSEEELKPVCDSFGDARIRFFRNEQHTNANVARNRGIKEAKGEYIAMLDSDDEYLPIHLARRVQKIKEWGCDGIFGSVYIFDGVKRTLSLSRPLREGELMVNYLLSDGAATTPTHFYKTSCANDILWDESLLRHQDYDFSVRFAQKYSFISDYEPTTVINWIKGEKRNVDLKSCVIFAEKIKQHASGYFLSKYFVQMYKVAILLADKNSIKYYKNNVIERINFLTIGEWLEFRNANTFMQKILFSFDYLFRLLLYSVR